MTERAIIKRIREKYGCEIVPINPKSITEILVDSGMKYFCYYPDMKIAILPPQPTEGLPTDFGLAIVNDIVKLMNGSIKVDGSTYTIIVSLEAAASSEQLDSMTFASLAGQRVLVADSNKASCHSALDYVRKLPIIAVTANAFAEDVQASRQAGMNEHIAKPLDFTRLHELLVKYLR